MTDYSSLYRPFGLGPLELPNRIVMAPMTRNMSPNNVPSDDVVEYYRRRAAGGTGLIITEGTCVDHIAASGYPDVPYFHGADSLAGWRRVVEAVHAEGGKIAPQLWHVGGMRKAGTPPEGDVDGYCPSGMNMPGKVNRRVMTQQDIHDCVDAFARGAAAAKELGFDAVEIHGAHGYLVDQFFWEGTNIRDDEYGGSMQKRSRFAIEIIEATRAAVGPDFPIIFRFSQWKQQDFDARLVQNETELEQFLMPLSEAGVDIFHCSTRRFWEPEFEGSDLNLAGWTKKITGKPTITVGSVGLNHDFIPLPGEATFREAEPASLDSLIERMERDEFDLVAVGRAMIANPDWAARVREGHLDTMQAFEKEQLFALT
ncbi:NADH:flavin oxidoreductase [Halieaceae bacterium IMCC14734]|uniref:NADH:flavin oxidoreductase n=1 Tax=Candidatus Litorirhabdus singularis TaxID=2518993 RepID=A0ABT3TFJ3_9GAMM|nr:NADH:flavin oxidoreductase [Candidatus Litorirhabdus singularis]MCX2981088.1 NADH:flavin oxidoreductase [Candidatus Litorirhabdus singularis]